MDVQSRRAVAAAVAVALALAPRPALAQPAEAERRFAEAEALLAAGKVAEACDAFEASNRLEARAGTLINIGLCKEQLGRLASALAAYRGALERVKDPRKKQVATDRAAALAPRVSQLTIALQPGASLPGLTITRDGQPVEPALLGRPVPVDGGATTIAAAAPGRAPWSTSIRIGGEGDRPVVTIPKLGEPAASEPAEGASPAEHAGASGLTGRRKIAIGAGVVGLGLIAGGAALGLSARGLEDDAFALCADFTTPCADAAQATALLDRANQRALVANVAYVAGTAAIVGAVVLWLTGGRAPAGERARVSVIPRAGGPGATLQVRF